MRLYDKKLFFISILYPIPKEISGNSAKLALLIRTVALAPNFQEVQRLSYPNKTNLITGSVLVNDEF